MTWRERRLITVLSIILAILSAAVLIVLGIRYREARARAEADPNLQITQAAEKAGSKYIALEYFNGATTLAFDLTETGKWVWRYDPAFPLDESTVQAILAALETLSPQQTLTDPEELETYGLDSPDAYFIATTPDQSYLRLDFGKATTDGASRYCFLNGSSSAVYIFSGELLELMKTPIYEMCILPELPALSTDNLLSISLFGSAGETDAVTRVTELTAQRPEGDKTAEATWRSEGANVTDDPAVRALLEDVSALTITRCVDYNPSEDAVEMCGFNSITARVTIGYIAANGEEERLLLTIASPLPDESGRYVRIGEDSTIYFLPTALLDPMMRIAVHGLEA